MKRRGRGFADGADVNAGDEADVSGDVLRAKTRAASRDASPSDVPDWPKDGARVSDLARLGDDITPEKHAMTRANDDGPAPYSNTSPEVLEVLSPERSAIHSTTKCPSAYDVEVDLASPVAADRARLEALLEDASFESAASARAAALLAGLENETRALDASAFSLRETVYEKKRLAETFALQRLQASKAAVALAARFASRDDDARDAMRRWRRLTENKKNTRWRPRSARGGDTRCGVRVAWSTAGPRTPRAHSWRRATRRDAVRGARADARDLCGGARVARASSRRRVGGARATREGRGRRGEEGARSRDKGRAGCARALACMDARSGFGQSRYRSRVSERGRRRLLSRRWRFGRFRSPGIEKERARRRARRECHDGRCALPVRRGCRRRLRALAGRASDASRFGNVSRFVIH